MHTHTRGIHTQPPTRMRAHPPTHPQTHVCACMHMHTHNHTRDTTRVRIPRVRAGIQAGSITHGRYCMAGKEGAQQATTASNHGHEQATTASPSSWTLCCSSSRPQGDTSYDFASQKQAASPKQLRTAASCDHDATSCSVLQLHLPTPATAAAASAHCCLAATAPLTWLACR